MNFNLSTHMARQFLPSIEKSVCQKLENQPLEYGEEYAAFVLTSVENKAKLSLCAFAGRECKRVLWTANAAEILELILNS